jgi:hypothetical protein
MGVIKNKISCRVGTALVTERSRWCNLAFGDSDQLGFRHNLFYK